VKKREGNINHSESIYLLTVRQTAQRLQLGVNRVYELVKAEHNPIPSITVGRSIRVPVVALERWLEAQTRG
jgi:excisionase family DNA binding protein